jgi:hypothetical protein
MKVERVRLLSSPYKSNSTLSFLALACCLSLAAIWLGPIKAMGAQSDLVATVADPGIDSYAESGLPNTPTLAVETFDNRPLRQNSAFNFGGASDVGAEGAGTFSGVGWIQSSSVYGGADSNSGTVGRHATADNNTIVLTMPNSSDYRYVGFWWSGGNSANYVDLVDDGVVVATFEVDVAGSTEDLAGLVASRGACGASSTNGYCGNPNYSPRAVMSELFAFVHLRYPPGFDQVRFRGAGFEFDNVTVSLTVPTLASTETTTETFVQYTLSTPTVLIADPRSSSLSFPGITLGAGTGETNAMLCFAQVTQAGGAIAGSADVLAAAAAATGITASSDVNIAAFSGARDSVASFAPTIDFQSIPSGSVFGSGSIFIRVTATPQSNLGSQGCTGAAAVSEVIEVRFLNLLLSDSVGIPID